MKYLDYENNYITRSKLMSLMLIDDILYNDHYCEVYKLLDTLCIKHVPYEEVKNWQR